MQEQEQAAAELSEREGWLTKYGALKRERDALAEELRELYPDAARKIADLFARIAENNKELDQLNRDRPPDVDQHLRSAELHARGLDSFTYNTPSLLDSVALFDWDTGHQILPPRPSSMAAASAATAVPACDRRFTADWAKDNDRRAAGQQAQQQRRADFYARAKLSSRRSARMRKRGSVSPRFSGKTAECPEGMPPVASGHQSRLV